MGLFRKKRDVVKVSKGEFVGFVERIKTHFLRIKDMQLHSLNRISRVEENQHNISTHFQQNMETVNKWIEYFSSMHKTQVSEIENLKGKINGLKKANLTSNHIDEDFIKRIVDEYIEIPVKDKKSFKKEIIEELLEVRKGMKGVINVNNDNIVNNATRYNVNNDYNAQERFTKSELKILAILFNATSPKSYLDLASSTGHSPNTIKVYINAMKKKGVKFEEIDTPNGSKLYAIPNKEKVRKLYNF